MRHKQPAKTGPIEFQVDKSYGDDSKTCFVLEGEVNSPGVESGMVVSVAMTRYNVVAEPIHLVRYLGEHNGSYKVQVLLALEAADDLPIFEALDISDELALIWQFGASIDPGEHFRYAPKIS